jgi:Ras-related protein Rab-7A
MKNKQNVIKSIVLIGEDNSGKTQIFNILQNKQFSEEYKQTIGVDSVLKQDENFSLLIWDRSGQEKYQLISSTLYQNLGAFLVCFDLSNKKSLENVSNCIQKFKEQTICGDDFKNIYLVGTKSDLKPEISDDDINQYISEYNKNNSLKISQSFYKTSAKENIGIDEMFIDVGNKLVTEKQQVQDVSSKLVTKTVNINAPNYLQNKYYSNDSDVLVKEDEYKIVENPAKVFLFSTFSAGSVGLFASIMLTIIFASNGLISHAACYGSLIASYITSIAAIIPTSTILGIGAIKNGVNIYENNKQVAVEKKYNLLCKFSGIEVKNTKEAISYMNMFDPTINVVKPGHSL